MPINNLPNIFLPIGGISSQPNSYLGFEPDVDYGHLIYQAGGGTIFGSALVTDSNRNNSIANTPGNYHAAHTALSDEILYNDTGLQISVIENDIISPVINKGIIQKDGSDYLWDEIFTTPLGLLTCVNAVSSTVYEFSQTGKDINLYLGNKNIVPSIGDYLVVQKYYVDNGIVTNTSTTDGVNNLPIHSKTTTYLSQILDISIIDVNTGNYLLTLDKDINYIVGTEYLICLLNRKQTSSTKELFYDTFQKIEIHRQQLLGDQYDYSGALLPLGKQNHLNYYNSEYKGIETLIGHIINPNNLIKTPFILLDADNNINDRLHAINNSIQIQLPNILLNEFPLGQNLILSNSNVSYIFDDYAGYYDKLYSNITNEFKGYVFYDLRIIVITDSELVTAMSYNSDRNFTLPEILLTNSQNELQNTLQIAPNVNIVQPYSHFITYRLKTSTNHISAPYSQIKHFNWGVNDIVEVLVNEFVHLVKDGNTTGYEADEIEFIIGKNIIDSITDPYNPKITGWENVVLMGNLDSTSKSMDLKISGAEIIHNYSFSKSQYLAKVATTTDFYDLTDLYGTGTTDSNLLTGNCNWLIGNVIYSSSIKKYTMNMTYNLDSGKWNGSSNPTYDLTNPLIKNILISEIGIHKTNGSEIDEQPYIYAKISPPIIKNNEQSAVINITLDF